MALVQWENVQDMDVSRFRGWIVFAAGVGILPFIWQIGVAFIGLAALCIAIAVRGDIKGGYADAIDTQWLIRREKRMREIEAKRSGHSKIYEHTP